MQGFLYPARLQVYIKHSISFELSTLRLVELHILVSQVGANIIHKCTCTALLDKSSVTPHCCINQYRAVLHPFRSQQCLPVFELEKSQRETVRRMYCIVLDQLQFMDRESLEGMLGHKGVVEVNSRTNILLHEERTEYEK